MTVWLSAGRSLTRGVGGVNHSVRNLAQGLAVRGHSIVLLTWGGGDRVLTDPDANGVRIARMPRGAGLPRGIAWLNRVTRPHFVHLNSLFLPHNSRLARWSFANDIPYAVQPRGALDQHALARRRLRKRAYLSIVERQVLRRASLAIGLTEEGIADYRRVCPNFSGSTAVVPNGVAWRDEVCEFPCRPASKFRRSLRIGYLGRLDVQHKGIDRIVEVASYLEGAGYEFHVHAADAEFPAEIGSVPQNMTLFSPVFGADKWMRLREMDCYVQFSRWEAFGNSIAEAMLAGVPVAVSSEANLSKTVADRGLGLVLDFGEGARRVATRLNEYLTSDAAAAQAERARAFAVARFTIEAMAESLEHSYAL